jgi:hypothetical protein
MSEFAYWINPKGQLQRPKTRHIASVIEEPEWFGETEESIKKTFDKYGEPVSTTVEGKAREDILLRVIKRGYARIRLNKTRRNQSYSVQIDRLTPKIEDTLFVWANIQSKDAMDKYADVNVYELGRGSGSGKLTRTSLDRIASGAGVKESVSSRITDLSVEMLEEIFLVENNNEEAIAYYRNEISFNDLSESVQPLIIAHRMRL